MAADPVSSSIEETYAGNLDAFSNLKATLAAGRVLAFVGAGASIPLAPTWASLLHSLIEEGCRRGSIPEVDIDFLKSQVREDPLEAANNIEDAFGRAQFRSYLASFFRLGERCTETHESLVALNLEGIVTLNYDDGLSTAYVRQHTSMPLVVRQDDRHELARWSSGHLFNDKRLPILHWHGNVSSPDKMILTAGDYNSFYSDNENAQFLADLWKNKKLLVVGFGFTDPFLVRIAESVSRNYAGDNHHYALIGVPAGQQVSALQRKSFSRKFRLTPIFYPVHESGNGVQDHSALTEILDGLRPLLSGEEVQAPVSISPDEPLATSSALHQAERRLKEGLYETPSGVVIYIDRTLKKPENILESGAVEDSGSISLDEIVISEKSYYITTPHEFGATTLAKSLNVAYTKAGYKCFIEDSNKLPAYKNKLLDYDFCKKSKNFKNVVILDDFDKVRNERLLKEIIGIDNTDIIIILQKAVSTTSGDIDQIFRGSRFLNLSLSTLKREEIRKIASQLYDTYDGDLVSAAVEKTYNDLLDLCIPLTPGNVIMYLNVIYKEGTFTPLNRLQIMERYIRDLLNRPSDAYRDAFNTENKLDIINAFTFSLFSKEKTSFTKKDWDDFCDNEMKQSLDWFDKNALLDDLILSRIIMPMSGYFVFKYKLFYSYFVGRYVAQRSDVLHKFIDEGKHLRLSSLVEMIAGSSKDNSHLIKSLTDRLNEAIRNFEEQYGTAGLDPYASLDWGRSPDEDERLWRPITKQLTSGPASNDEVDKLKRSILAEERTADQAVIIQEFTGYEGTVSFNQEMLIGALRESQRLDGKLKIEAMNAIFHAYQIVMQIGFLFAPIIASRRYFVWNNFAFVNDIRNKAFEEGTSDERTAMVAWAIPYAVTSRAAEEIGSRKLGEVYKALSVETGETDFSTFLNFALLLRSKPENWPAVARETLGRTGNTAAYLRCMLSSSMREFNQEVNTSTERSEMKKLIANIQAKRQLKKAIPAKGLVNKVLKRLENTGFFNSDDQQE